MNFYAVHLWPLWLLLLLAFFGLLSWKSLAGGTTGRRAVAFALRAGVLALLALALMDIHWTRVAERLAVVFVMDRSQSVPPSLREEALSRVRAATATLEEETLAGMVVFGEAASIESTPDPRPDFSRIASVVGADRTDVGAALRLAGSSFPHGVQKRIVLLSDGRPNLGEALREAAAVRGQGAVVDVVPLLYGHVNDVRVEKVVAPARVAEGEPIPLRIVLQAGAPARVRLDLRLDGKTVAQEEVVLDAGKTVLPIERPVEGPGFHTFEVQVDAPDDSQPQNNRGFAFTIVSGKPRVLVIEDVPGEARFLLEALRLHGVEAQGIPPSAGPVTPSEFQAWDAVFLCNVPADAFSSDQLKALEAGVRDLGLGLVMIGGEHSFGAGDWNGTPSPCSRKCGRRRSSRTGRWSSSCTRASSPTGTAGPSGSAGTPSTSSRRRTTRDCSTSRMTAGSSGCSNCSGSKTSRGSSN
jgi:hypothetical protein